MTIMYPLGLSQPPTSFFRFFPKLALSTFNTLRDHEASVVIVGCIFVLVEEIFPVPSTHKGEFEKGKGAIAARLNNLNTREDPNVQGI